ncbi:MAG: hypothetical protein RIG84_09210 [Roseovarius sp.]
MTTRYANLLIDTADSLAAARSGEAAWEAINQVGRRIGANAVNAGAFLRGVPQIAWMRSSMRAEWLGDYAGQGFHEIDPLLGAALEGRAPALYDVARRGEGLAQQSGLGALHDGMMAHGYNYMICHSWFDGSAGKCLVLSCEDDPRALFGPGTEKAFSAISAMLTLGLHPPGEEAQAGAVFGADWAVIAPEERDVLSYLAIGLSEQAVAEKLRLTQGEVARRLAAAARRLKAETLEQTLALALTRGLLAI